MARSDEVDACLTRHDVPMKPVVERLRRESMFHTGATLPGKHPPGSRGPPPTAAS
ncbi:MAG: hypothetical protein IPM79_12790 [Polyangiaceae bacterium]|jgi:hypothetical protein|nr:hypothetical protein [Polyangiaceae bacterium]MBK8938482.1 hypothetical protein [Polyangiaceae bacterium]